ncbi:hypothetical protein H6G26_32235 [Nostoc sp. FACHB-888]|nr:hypothetical protein [Nostoc sp. FACHB-888]
MAKKPFHRSRTVAKSRVNYVYSQTVSLPGTLNIEVDALPPKIVLIDYNEVNQTQVQLETPEECAPYLDTESVSWVDVRGLGNQDIMQRLGRVFSLPPLILEDVVNVPERPKVEDYENQLVIIARMVITNERETGFYSEQVSFVLGKHYLLTIQEEPERDCFESVRARIRNNKGTIRKQKADYLEPVKKQLLHVEV